MRREWRRLRQKEAPELNITAFMNLMVILVPFLLITAVFSRLAILELNLPAAAQGEAAKGKGELQIEVIVRPAAIEVADRRGGLIRRLDSGPDGYDLHALSEILQKIKGRVPEKLDATILLEPETPYDTLVQVMDAVRVVEVEGEGRVRREELFPEISIGDAPPTRLAAVTD
jgi:biopolymer transport protein ExbD